MQEPEYLCMGNIIHYSTGTYLTTKTRYRPFINLKPDAEAQLTSHSMDRSESMKSDENWLGDSIRLPSKERLETAKD